MNNLDGDADPIHTKTVIFKYAEFLTVIEALSNQHNKLKSLIRSDELPNLDRYHMSLEIKNLENLLDKLDKLK